MSISGLSCIEFKNMSTPSKPAPSRRFFCGTILLALAGALLPAAKSESALVMLEISGTAVTSSGGVFDENGAVPFLFSLTYDTLLDTNTEFRASGAMLGSATTTHEWHGYSKDGLTATSLTFGTNTWTASNISSRMPTLGVSADLWFDTDIAVSVPTRMWMRFGNSAGSLELGPSVTGSGTIELKSGVFIEDPNTFEFASTMSATITAVPEARAWLMLGVVTTVAGAVWCARR
jgi:hypothetical protein